MSALKVEPVEVKTKFLESPSGIRKKEILDSPPCAPCLENAGTDTQFTADLDPRLAAVLGITGATGRSPHDPYYLCRSHAIMMLGNRYVTEVLSCSHMGEKP